MITILRWKVKSEKWKVREGEIGDCHSYDVESDDDEGTYGYIRYDRMSDAIENLAAVEDSKEETNICRIEQDDMQHVLFWEESVQMPGEKKNAGRETEDAADEIMPPSAVPEQMILPEKVAYIIIR